MGPGSRPFEIPAIIGRMAGQVAIGRIGPLIMRRGEAWPPARSTTRLSEVRVTARRRAPSSPIGIRSPSGGSSSRGVLFDGTRIDGPSSTFHPVAEIAIAEVAEAC